MQKDKNSVHNGHCRHKCSICGRVRFAKFLKLYMEENSRGYAYVPKTRFGNHIWFCVDNPDCLQQIQGYRPY